MTEQLVEGTAWSGGRAGSASALEFVTYALGLLDRLVGADPAPPPVVLPPPARGQADGSDMISWAAARVAVPVAATVTGIIDALLPLTLTAAVQARGAILVGPGLIGVSLGDLGARAIAPVDGRYVICSAVSPSFTAGGRLPGLVYPPSALPATS